MVVLLNTMQLLQGILICVHTSRLPYIGEMSTWGMESMVKCMLGQSEIMCIYLDLMFGCYYYAQENIECTIVYTLSFLKFLSPQYFLESTNLG